MLRIVKLAIFWIAFGTALGIPSARAQQPADPSLAPMPAQIFSAKKAFISNASGEFPVAQGVPELTYNEFYADMKSWGRYELVGTPVDADLVFEIRYLLVLGDVNVSNGSGGSSRSEQLRVTILDPKTHVVLWAFTRWIPGANRQVTGRKNFDATMAALVNNIRSLASQPAPAAASSKN